MRMDAHVHLALNGIFTRKDWLDADEKTRHDWISKVLAPYLSLDIGIIRDGGDAHFISAFARPIAKELGLIYKTPIHGFYKTGYYGGFLGKPVSDLQDIKEACLRLQPYRPDHIKIILTGIVDFTNYGGFGGIGFLEKELAYLIAWGRDQGLPVMVHANGSEGVQLAIRSGASTIEHGYLITKEEVAMMKEYGTVWVPTLAPLGNILEKKEQRFASQHPVIAQVFREQQKNIYRALEQGVSVALGSDAGAYAVTHGTGLFDEMRHFQEIGLSREIVEELCQGGTSFPFTYCKSGRPGV